MITRRRLASAAIVGATAIAAAMFVFGWQLHRGAALTLVPLAIAVAIVGAWRLPDARRERVAIALFLGICAIYGAEIMLGRSKPRDATAAAARGQWFDTRTPGEVVKALRRKGMDAYPSVPPREAASLGESIVPLGGVSDRWTVFCNEGGSYTIYESDERGFNNPKGLWGRERADIAILGEAFLQGACVDRGKGAADLVRAKYPATLSLAMAEDGPILALAGIEELLPEVKPRIVLWFHYNRMLGSLDVEKASPVIRRYVEGQKQGIFANQAKIDAFIRERLERRGDGPAWPSGLASLGLSRDSSPVWLQDLVMGEQHSSAAAAMRLDWVTAAVAARTSRDQGGGGPPDYPLYAKVLARARTTVASWGGKLVFVYLADVHNLRGKDHPSRAPVLEMVRAAGIPLVDLQPAFAAVADPTSLRFHEQSHYNEAGYRLLADTVLAGIAKLAEDAGIAPSR